MTTPIASPVLRARQHSPRHWLRYAGPVVAVVLAGLAVGRFVTVGSSGGSSNATRTPVASEVAPDDASGLTARGVAALQEAIRTGDPSYYGVATESLDAALRLAPDNPDVLAARAVLALSVHDFAGALPLAEQAVAANPLSTAALAALVDAHVENGQYVAAEAALGRLLDANPGVGAYARVSYFRQLSGDVSGAEVAMRQAVAAAAAGSERAVVLTYLGDIQLERGAVGDAVASYRSALREQPGFVLAELGAARAQIASGDFAGAATRLDVLVNRSPQPAVATLRGELALITGDAAAADASFELVRANEQILRSQGVVTDLESALFDADHGDAAAAVDAAHAAYAARHTIFTADAVAWALLRNGDADAALPYVEESLAGGIDSPNIRVHAAAVFAALGDTARASDELRTAFEGLPWLTPAIRPVAFDLAATLAVDVPEGWLQ